jgi:TPR repeat protein
MLSYVRSKQGEAKERQRDKHRLVTSKLTDWLPRHGWGCQPNTARAVTYLTAAASNSATIESEALHAGVKKGGAAKGELVLAIFELANCYRNGWGVDKDPVAARTYYETAANLGDTDAMNETAWCYLEGFGGKKDKVRTLTDPMLPTFTACQPSSC